MFSSPSSLMSHPLTWAAMALVFMATPIEGGSCWAGCPEAPDFTNYKGIRVHARTFDSLRGEVTRVLTPDGKESLNDPSVKKLEVVERWNYATYPVPIENDIPQLRTITDLHSKKVLTLEGEDKISFSFPTQTQMTSGASGSPSASLESTSKGQEPTNNSTFRNVQQWKAAGVVLNIEDSDEYMYAYQLQIPGTDKCLASNAIQGDAYLYQTPLIIRSCKPGPGVSNDIADPKIMASSKNMDHLPDWLDITGLPNAKSEYQTYMNTFWLITISDFNKDTKNYPKDGPAHLNNLGDYVHGYWTCMSSSGFMEACDNDINNPSQRFTIS
ncbi:MAG: hypothetical protein DHS80DRAFT_24100 [Piptocephalis tieghemiana]|nr:MAG: hypothetical protein DHS80DRAFT_24100 [Piptocephalis tieghemiana]